MVLTQRGPVPGATGRYRMTFAATEDPGTGFYSVSSGLWDFYSANTKALGFGLTSSDPSITAYSQELKLLTDTDSKPVHINVRNYTQASGDTVAAQFTPNQTVTTTGEVFGAQFKPRAASNVDVASVNGIGIDAELKSGTGNASADLRLVNGYLGATGSGTISGDVVGIRLRHEVSATVTGDSVALDIDDNEGSTDWTHFLKLGAALGTHGMTTNTDKTGNAKSGTIKVKAGGTLYHIQLYANA